MKAFDPLGALGLLVRREIDFVLVGGLAARLYGSPTVTDDLDICHAKAPLNLKRLAGCLREIHARLRGAEDLEFLLDERLLAGGENFTFSTDLGFIDCLARPAGVDGYGELARSAIEMDLGDFTIKVAGLDDLMTMKRSAGRRKDLIELEILQALADETTH